MATYLLFATAALILAFILDLIIGDPPRWPHLIRGFGWLIQKLEKALYSQNNKKLAGAELVVLTLVIGTGLPMMILVASWSLSPWVYLVVEALLCWQLLAVKSLRVESGLVGKALDSGDILKARHALSMIVGRDTADLDEEGILRATVETIAENSADGVTAPLFYLAFGGASLGCLFKATNTMDSMVGYKNERYQEFGSAAAHLDDVLNYIPARLCALLMVVASALTGLDSKQAWRIWRRDRHNHASPNSAQSESVMAGALGIRLAGPAVYKGITLDKPWIGDDLRSIVKKDVKTAQRLLLVTAILSLTIALCVRIVIWCLIYIVL